MDDAKDFKRPEGLPDDMQAGVRSQCRSWSPR